MTFRILFFPFIQACLCGAMFHCLPASARAAEQRKTHATAGDTQIQLSEAASFLRLGEKLVFKLGWGIVTGAGLTTIETIPPEAPGKPVRVRVLTESRGIVRALYPLDNNSVCHIDPETGRPEKIEISGRGGSRESRSTTVFDYEEGVVRHTDAIRPNRSGTAELPDEAVYDIMVTMLKLRETKLAVGETRRLKIAFADDIYDLELSVLEQDRIKTGVGTFDAVAVEPQQKGELKGFFARGGSMKFWLSQGERPQIVRMDFRVKVGTITGVLVEVGRVELDEDTRS